MTMQRENEAFLTEQIITYIGNKRSLLDFIGKGVSRVQAALGKEKLRMADLFAGSGIVARYLKARAASLHVNDAEPYAAYLSSCYLSNRSEVNAEALRALLPQLKEGIRSAWQPGFIAELYAPRNDEHIQPGERAFYTRRNAIYLDTARQLIAQLPENMQRYFLAPLLCEASVHTNTSGVFKGFYKNRAGVGQFGGEGRHALPRITGAIELKLPVFSSFECPVSISCAESLAAARHLPEQDLIYLDPPYNQHPYGSNYFMLNLLLENKRPERISPVSGIPEGWQRSAYNKPRCAAKQLFELIDACPAPFILLSYNSEGFISREELEQKLSARGNVTPLETDYATFRGSRNLRDRNLRLKEYLFLLEKA